MFFLEQSWRKGNWKGNGPFSNKYGYIHHIICIYIVIYRIYYMYIIYIYSIWNQTDLHDFASLCINDPPWLPDRKGHVRERSKVFLGGGKMAARPRPAPGFFNGDWRLTRMPMLSTPLKFNMEQIPFGNHHFQVPC